MANNRNVSVNIYIRPKMVAGKRPSYKKLNRKKIYSEGTKFSLGYTDPSSKKWKWETIDVPHQNGAEMAALSRAAELKKGLSADGMMRSERRTLRATIPAWLERIRHTRAAGTYISYRISVTGFQATCPKTYVDELTLRDLEIFQESMIGRYSDQTIHQHFVNLSVYLNAHNVTQEKNGRSMPLRLHHPFRQKEVVTYTDAEFTRLCDASPREEKELWTFLRVTGFRKGEAAVAAYSDINARESSIRVTSKPDHGWKPKSAKGHRSIPIPSFLLQLLQARQAAQPGNSLIFPDKDGKPCRGQFLRLLKARAFAAGLNCGNCQTKQGSCADGPYCHGWFLHKLRSSFATISYSGGVKESDASDRRT